MGLGEWHKLIPDLSSALVTAGRGTRGSAGSPPGVAADRMSPRSRILVAASKTPDGRLAVLYLPNSTTVMGKTSLLVSGWTRPGWTRSREPPSSAGNWSTTIPPPRETTPRGPGLGAGIPVPDAHDGSRTVRLPLVRGDRANNLAFERALHPVRLRTPDRPFRPPHSRSRA